jgi:Rad52/22 family double-strand break repair protein
MTKQERRASGTDTFACASLAEALPHLRRPPSAAAVRFKIQNAVDEAAQVAAYIDARLVFDRLDHVCGQEWSAWFDALPGPLIPPPVDRDGALREPPPVYVRCHLALYGVTREDVGEGQDPKAAFSDAIKRAAVHFGVGRALYAMRLPWLREGDADSELRRNRRGRLVLDRRSEAWCRGMYERWLSERGIAQFGEPLEHGDETGAAGFEGQCRSQGTGAGDERQGIDQGQWRRGEAGPRGASADSRVPGPGDGSALPGRGRPVRAARSVGRLRPVADGGRREPPADSGHRVELARWRRAGRFEQDTVAALAGLLFGEGRLKRLDDPQVGELALCLEFAVRGRVAPRTLAGAITRLSKRDDREEAARALRAWLIEKANERELLGRRRAA